MVTGSSVAEENYQNPYRIFSMEEKEASETLPECLIVNSAGLPYTEDKPFRDMYVNVPIKYIILYSFYFGPCLQITMHEPQHSTFYI